jgi:phosphate transport system permease protein
MKMRNLSQFIAFSTLRLVALVVVIPVVFVIFVLFKNGWGAMSWNFIMATPSGDLTKGGLLYPIVGTLYLVGCTILMALPLGLLSAIFLSEYAKKGKLIRIIRLAIVNLAGVPSIVYGLFGYGVFCLMLNLHESIIAGSMTLAILILPVVIVASEEALTAVPQGYREASLALGATKWQTTYKVVLPNALPGIITGSILGISRAAGETAPILFTCVAAFMPSLPKSLFDKCMALPYHLYNISTQVPDAPLTIQWGTALTLLIIAVGLNIAASFIRVHFRKNRAW